jgi:GxxExxY protein
LQSAEGVQLDRLNELSHRIIGAGIDIHRVVGPGLLESTYRPCMIYELRDRELKVVAEQTIPVRYKDLVLDGGYRIDLLVEDTIIVELKSVESILPVHFAQVLSYLRHTNKPLVFSSISMWTCWPRAFIGSRTVSERHRLRAEAHKNTKGHEDKSFS